MSDAIKDKMDDIQGRESDEKVANIFDEEPGMR